MMAYKSVHISELCRLCACSKSPLVGIYSEEGRKKRINAKITDSLHITVHETDRLPKSVCTECLKQLEMHDKFRETAVEAQGMLESCLKPASMEKSGMVYIRQASDQPAQAATGRTQTAPSGTTTRVVQTKQTTTQQGQQQQQQRQQQKPPQRSQLPVSTASMVITSSPKNIVHTVNGTTNSTGTMSLTAVPTTIRTSNGDQLSTIIQAVGIKPENDSNRTIVVGQPQQQQQQQTQHAANQSQILTIQNLQSATQPFAKTFDGQMTIRANNTLYKLENGTLIPITSKAPEVQTQTTLTQVDEFLKPKVSPTKLLKRAQPQSLTVEPVPVKKKRIIQIVKNPPVTQTSVPKTTTTVGNITIESPSVGTLPVATPASSGTIVCTTGPGTIYTTTPISVPQKTFVRPNEVKVVSAGNKCLLPIVVKSENASVETTGTSTVPSVTMSTPAITGNVPQNSVQVLHVKVGPDGVMRFAPVQHPPLAMQQSTMPQYSMGTVTTNGQQVASLPPMAILGQTQPMVQGQISAGNYVTLVGKTSSQTQTVGDANGQQMGVLIATSQAAQSSQQPVPQQQQQQHQPQQQIQIHQTQIVKKSQPTPPLPTVQQRTVTVSGAGPVQKTNPRSIPTVRKAAPTQPTNTLPKLVHVTTGSKTTTVANRPVSNLKSTSTTASTVVRPSVTAGRTGQQTTTVTATVSNGSAHNSSAESADFDESGPESGESDPSRSVQSMMASQQMSAISAMSCKQEPMGSDQLASGGTGGENAGTGVRRDPASVSFTTCAVCQKQFGRKEHLVQHLKSHLGLRPFKCEDPTCNKSFNRKEHLLRHRVSHTGQKRFRCDKCDKLFSRKDNLNKHRKTHQEQPGATQSMKHKLTHDSSGEDQAAPKPPLKKELVVKAETKPAVNSGITYVESPVISKSSTQPPPLAQTPVSSVVTSDPATSVVQSLPLTITHVPTSSATIQLPTICANQQQVHQLIQQQQPQNGTTQQQIIAIPAHISTANGKQIIQHLQITLPHHVTGQTVSTSTSSAATSGSVQNSVFAMPPNFIFDTSQLMTTNRQT
ncbi:transcription factor Sp4 [Anopheles nili]|uniref:transcription factor Sp4 n=1 Tax=Anopheles nili TaxID=185578 RepID=UPI00237A3605|nr:transcription factor Sp4 [Anopheles nili]